MRTHIARAFLITLGILGVASTVSEGQGPKIPADSLSAMQWRYIGPEGNRFSAIAGVPGDPLVVYAGSASGGIFKTTDGGINWTPIFDSQPVNSIGDIAVAPSDPAIVWAGTGESCIRSHISVGEGIFKSTDAGRTWTRMGLEKTGRIGKVIIDPQNPDIVLACALGHAYGPQQERGVYRTTDGGKTWDRTLFADENTGCSDMEIDPRNSRKLFAGMWTLDIKTWGRESGGPGSGLYTSNNGGVTWQKLSGHGLPTKTVGKTMVAIARSNPERVYALFETGDGMPWKGQETETGQLWRSDNGGADWQRISSDRNWMGRAHYYSHMEVAPDNENEAYAFNASWSISRDGGRTLEQVSGQLAPGGDHHDLWIDPTNPGRMLVAHDQGLSLSGNRGKSWTRLRLGNAQMYHVTVDTQIPYYVYGNKQDGPSYRGPSNSKSGGFGGGGGGGDGNRIPRSAWHGVLGGESGFATPDPGDPNIIWSSASGSGSVGGIVVRYELNKRQGRNVEVWPDQANGVPGDLKYRFNWVMPLAISPHDHNIVYVGSQHVHRTTNGGQSWEVISPDLSTNDKARQQFSGGLTGDNIGVEYAFVVMAIAESPKERGVIWAGTNDGQVQLTRDAGKTWTNVTKNITGLPQWGTVSNIEPSRYDAGTAYIAVDLHQVNNRDPFVYKTSDYGKTWKAITSGIPRSMLSYAHCVREDPVRKGLLYLGTENALYVSFDDGENWQPLQAGLPPAPVYWLTFAEHMNDLVIATYGRGFYVLDDLSPLQQFTPQVLSSEAHLFTPRPAYRFREVTNNYTMPNDATEGRDPAYGASLSFYLRAATDATVTLEDEKGQTVRTLKVAGRPGINRVTWDLRHEPTKEVRLRTKPLYIGDFEMPDEGWRSGGQRFSILTMPGTYTVKLSAGGREQSQKLVVRKDPNSGGSEAELTEQMKTLSELRATIDNAADVINQAELVRYQLQELPKLAADPEIAQVAKSIEQKFTDLEMNLAELRSGGRGQDGVRFGAKLYGKLNYVAQGLMSNDYRPTAQQLEVQKLHDQQVRDLQSKLNGLLNTDIAMFNDKLKARSLSTIMVPTPPKRPTSSQ